MTVLVAIVSCVPMGYWSVLLFSDVRADIRELLPEGARSVQTLRELERRFGGWSQLSILVESPSRDANRKFSDDLVAALQKIEGVRSARNRVGPERDFFEPRWHLFVELDDLELIRERIEDAGDAARRRANPLLVDLDGSDTATMSLDFSDITAKYESRRAAVQRFEDGYFESKDGKTLAVILRRRGLAFALGESQRIVNEVQAAVARLKPGTYHDELVVGLGGDVKNVLEVHESLIEDLIAATSIVTVLLLAVVLGYYRRWRALYLIGIPVLVGTAWTFGISHFAVGYLNASTAFLAAIIPGNGVNFGLIMLARYIEERRRGRSIDDSLGDAVRHTWQATSTAAAAASIAYGSLIATDFLGFKHFGVIGGIGMVLCWIATFAILPPLILITERRRPLSEGRPIPLPLPKPGTFLALPATWVARWPRPFAFGGALTGLVAGIVTVVYLDDPFEKDFDKLRGQQSQKAGAAFWEKKVDDIFGRYLIPQIIIADRAEDVPHIVESLETIIRDGGETAPITEVTALTTLVPPQQAEKIEVLDEIRALLSDDAIANLSDEQRALAEKYRPPDGIEPFTQADLPDSIRADFRELDGTEGRVVLVLPNLALNLYHADEIKRVSDALRSLRLPDGRIVESSGNFVIYSDMLEAVAADGPKATAYSLIGVVLLCMIVFRRPRRAAIVIASLLCGVAWMGAGLAATDLKINFLNFIGLPITFGIGVDYAVNILSRGVIEEREHVAPVAAQRAIIRTGGAVVLCSLTTVIGYGSLLIAHNGALVSFGKIAILGELTCIVAALVVMPAWMIIWRERNSPC